MILRTLRIKQELSQNELARMVGVTQGYISALEVGRKENPSIKVLSKIAEVLGTSVGVLISEHKEAV